MPFDHSKQCLILKKSVSFQICSKKYLRLFIVRSQNFNDFHLEEKIIVEILFNGESDRKRVAYATSLSYFKISLLHKVLRSVLNNYKRYNISLRASILTSSPWTNQWSGTADTFLIFKTFPLHGLSQGFRVLLQGLIFILSRFMESHELLVRKENHWRYWLL